ncbi:hypothetical protein [Streptomyces sp. NPDC017448]|uniref:hypothetical protein n=1 Tax=Streptomyces sp. NPDC017448 TaxID=3364996 RepID=UPI0037A20D67
MTFHRYDEPEVIEEGLRLGEDDEFTYECWPQMYNDRLVLRSKKDPYTYEYGWCFPKQLGVAVAAALAVWNPETQDEPVGWHKRAVQNIRRAPRRDEDPAYNRERCVHGSYMDAYCTVDLHCPRDRARMTEDFDELLRRNSLGGGLTEEQKRAEAERQQRAEWIREIRELHLLLEHTPAQLRRIAEIVEALEGDAAAREHWERAARAGNRDAKDYLTVVNEEAAEKEEERG